MKKGTAFLNKIVCSKMDKNKKKYRWIFFLALMAIGAFFLLFRLGDLPFADYDETSYALIISEAIANKDYLSFTHLGHDYFEKPPLYFWLAIGSSKIFSPPEFAMRLPSVLFCLLAIVFTWLMVLYLTENKTAAFLAGLALILTGEFIFASRQIRMDVPVAAAILFSVYCFVRGLGKPKWFLGIGIGVAAGFLFKNVIGLFSLPIILIFAFVCKKWSWLKSGYFWLSAVIALALLAPWHIYQTLKFGQEFWRGYFLQHVLGRFSEPIIGGQISIFHYIKYLFMLVEPWMVVFVLVLLWYIFKRAWRIDKAPLAFLGGAIFIFAVFSIAQTKLFYYLEPIYPFIIIFITLTILLIYDSWQKPASDKKKIFAFFIGLLIVIGLINLYWQVFDLRKGFTDEYPTAQEEMRMGQYLLEHPSPAKVYAFNWLYLETLRYYSQGREISVLVNTLDVDDESFFLIMPSQFFKLYEFSPEFLEMTDIVYQGIKLTMFEVHME